MVIIIGNVPAECEKLCAELKANGFFALAVSAERAFELAKESKCKIIILLGGCAETDKKIKAFDESIVTVRIFERGLPSLYRSEEADYQLFLPISAAKISKKLHFIYTSHFGLSLTKFSVGAVSVNGGKVFVGEGEPRFTGTENLIVRFLAYSYPDFVSAKIIAELCGVSEQSVSALISALNKKARRLYAAPIISPRRFRGYKLNYIK